MLSLGHIIFSYNITFYLYADDTQNLSLICDPANSYKNTINLLNCFNDILKWMSKSFLQLNADKTEILILDEDSANAQLLNSPSSSSQQITQHCRYFKIFKPS